MANKPINQLDNASSLDATDLLVLWDSSTNTAQNMTGQQFTTWLTALAAGKGGISSISKTGTAGLVDTYTITYADASTSTFTVTNGAKGDQGNQTYVWIAYSATEPDSDSDMSLIPAPWMGIYVGLESTQGNLHYTDYTWYEIKGPKGDGVAYTAQTGEVGLTRTYTMYTADGTPVGSFSVTDGAGAVSTVNGIAPDGEGNVLAVVTSVEDLGLTVGSATIAEAYSALAVSQILFAPATDFAVGELPLVSGTRQTYGTVEIIKATSDGSRGRINFYGKEAGNKDFRMYLASNNVPSGTWVAEITPSDMNSFFGVTTISRNVTVPASDAVSNFTITGTAAGWVPIALAGWEVNNDRSTFANVNDLYISNRGNGTVTVTMSIRNLSATASTWGVVVYILWRKNM